MTRANPPTRRVFVALRPNTPIRDALTREVAAIEQMDRARLRLLPAYDWHITLRFIGAIDSDRLNAFQAKTHDIASRHEPFSLHFTHIESFPSTEHPRVLAATGPATPAAQELVSDLEAACRALDLCADTRKWRCHLTLARIQGRRAFGMIARPIDLTMAAQSLELMESTVAGQQRRYVAIETAVLAAR